MLLRLTNRIFPLLICAILMALSSCNKGNDQISAKSTPDSTQVGTAQNISPNCVDSMVGTYYGRTIRWGSEWSNGTLHHFSYDDPDTLFVSKSGPDGISVSSKKIPRGDHFVFDSSQTMTAIGYINFERCESTLDYVAYQDSVRYSFSFVGSNEGLMCGFSGKK